MPECADAQNLLDNEYCRRHTLAPRVGRTRQKVNYHLRLLEQHGLVELVEERRRGNCTERVLEATARAYVISPTALSAVAPDLSRTPDQRSARWLLSVAGRVVAELLAGAQVVDGLVAEYHDEAAPRGRPHRFLVALHPTHEKEDRP